MLTNYIHQVMRRAHFELMENGRFYGSIPGFQGVWSEGATLEECRDDLVETLEGWLIVKLRCKATSSFAYPIRTETTLTGRL